MILLSLLLAADLGALAAELERGPWLVDATSASASVCWRVGGVDSCRPCRGAAGGVVSYQVPGSTLSWRARLLPGPEEPVRFAAFGDSGKGNEAQRRVAALLDRQEVDLALVLGDIIYPSGKDEHYGPRYFEPYAPSLARIPFFPAIGNHDYGNSWFRRKGLRRLAVYSGVHRRPRYYSFDAGPVHFVSLDTNQAYGIDAAASVEEGGEQWLWLDRDLGGARAPWKVVLLHVPIHTTVRHGDHALLQRHLEPLLRRRGVALVLQGHDHIYERFEPVGGVTYVTAGTGGAGLHRGRRGQAGLVRQVRAHGLLVGSATAERLSARFLDDAGVERDRFSLDR